jgi:predicted RNase H-like HicB family nuclease
MMLTQTAKAELTVRVENTINGHFIATSIDLPDLQSQAASREEAIADLESKIKKRLITTEIVTLSLPIMPKSNPWLDIFGKYAADPDFDRMLFHIETERKLNDDEKFLDENQV